jgi:hypothetical protein
MTIEIDEQTHLMRSAQYKIAGIPPPYATELFLNCCNNGQNGCPTRFVEKVTCQQCAVVADAALEGRIIHPLQDKAKWNREFLKELAKAFRKKKSTSQALGPESGPSEP